MRPPTDLDATALAQALSVDDLLVFEIRARRASLRGGAGRGVGWAGVVEVELDDEPLLQAALDEARVVRAGGDAASRIVGAYRAAHAAVAPVGEHLVVFGATRPIRASSAELIRRATEAVAVVGEVPASKLLADELELAHAVRQLGEHPPASLAETARHVAAVAADALSCEIGAVLLRRDGTTEVHGAGPAWEAMNDDALCSALHDLAADAATGPIVEQDLAAAGRSGLQIVSCFALGIGRSESLGALIVGHTADQPRGFTLLCQRVGRALADAAEPILRAAMAHEELAAQRDRFALEARTDPLTGLGNRVVWEHTLAMEQARAERTPRHLTLLAVDIDGLKATNDAHGHRIGDELLIGAADILRTAVRAGDVVARLGGDEFAVLLADAGTSAAEAVRSRIQAGCATWVGSEPLARLSLAVGAAIPEPGESLTDAFCRADDAMYAQKRATASA